jgi:DNA-binding CsgD family transcriptional regulator
MSAIRNVGGGHLSQEWSPPLYRRDKGTKYVLPSVDQVGLPDHLYMTSDSPRPNASLSMSWAAIEKSLLNLHGSTDIHLFWKAVQRIIQIAIPQCFLGLAVEHDPRLAITARWTCQLPAAAFRSAPFRASFGKHPRTKFLNGNKVFPTQGKLTRSAFYRQYMAPHQCVYLFALVFSTSPVASCVMAIMRNEKQGELTEHELRLLNRLYPQFHTALRRVAAREREQIAHLAFEEFIGRLPLPTILLRWNLQVTYQNQAAREFCTLWQGGPEMARALKAGAPVPEEILAACRVLKSKWENASRSHEAARNPMPEVVHNPNWPHLRATVSIRPPAAGGVARPNFLIECEDLRPAESESGAHREARLPHLARLTRREQELTRLVCEGHSNQEIAEDAGMSLATVKKHLYSIFRKLEVASRARLIALMR